MKSRYFEVKKANICTNCLRSGHTADKCTGKKCQICDKRHNTLLHDKDFYNNRQINNSSSGESSTNANINNERQDFQNQSTSNQNNNSRTNESDNKVQQASHITLASHHEIQGTIQILLATAEVYILDVNKKPIKCRALLDSASQSNFLTAELFHRLNLTGIQVNTPVTGINQTACNISHKAQAKIESRNHSYKASLEFLVLNKITSCLPQVSFDMTNCQIPNDIWLADPKFNISQEIDILLGTEIFFELLNAQQIKLGKRGLHLQSTKLGWIITGPININSDTYYNGRTKCFLITNNTLHDDLERFWALENIHNSHAKLSNEELDCEKHFRENYEQDTSGRFTVKLPFRENMVDLGESLDIATKRLHSVENKLMKNSELQKQYTEFLQEYEAMGHMTKLKAEEISSANIQNYLPHHPVLKESSITTRLRVVYDASCKTSTGISLNDILKVGPKVQCDLVDIVIRMRTHQIAITADIAKMYRMINIHESQRDFQRIVWRSDRNQEISHFRLNTITYGTASASFLATRTLHQVGLNCKNEYPQASLIITQDFYMDDLLTGVDTFEEAVKLKRQLETILSESGFTLRKWLSNDMRIFEKSEHLHEDVPFQINDSKEAKTLGLLWEPCDDTLLYKLQISQKTQMLTKRIILSNIAKIFDPLGLISPCMITAKIMLQRLWQNGLDWDEAVPESIKISWSNFIEQIVNLNSIKIPRCIVIPSAVNIFLHGFCDSSELAYGASVYLCSENMCGEIQSHLVCAKSRLAPLKSMSLPRLELCGALLLAQLMNKIKTVLRLKINKTIYWTDSQIVLAWLNAESNKWKTFVSNRVSEIQELSEQHSWRHVESSQNPADIISRGTSPEELKNNSLWWHGPSWITKDETHWPEGQIINISDIPEARKEKIILSFHVLQNFDIISRFSTFKKLQHVTAYVLRFIHNTRSRHKFSGNLSSDELDNATMNLCKVVQQESFNRELTLLKQNKTVHNSSKLLTLTPFLDSDGIIRVGGRLKNANIPFDQKYPIVLPSKHKLTKLLIKHTHSKYLHAGAQFILSQMRKQFWPLNGRNAIRSVLRNCLTCFRVKPATITQLMGDLPESRLTPTKPFTHCGIDYAGPYLMKDGKLRTRTFIKIYLCVYICLTTKATHVELVTDLSTDAFMDSFKRFVSRRGLCKHIYTDNATNFIGASNELRKIHAVIANAPNSNNYQNYFQENQIQWHFIPPRSPHFGGMWESAIKSFKYHIKRIIGDSKLNFEQFYTLVTQVEAILNSRPLIPLSNDPCDLQALTPGHFLVGCELTALPQEAVFNIAPNRLSQYKQLQHMVQNFWLQWSRDYLHTLSQRAKWSRSQQNIEIGTLVLIQEDNLPPMRWSLGRVTAVHPGADNLVRVVSVQCKQGVIKRSINKLCPLPFGEI